MKSTNGKKQDSVAAVRALIEQCTSHEERVQQLLPFLTVHSGQEVLHFALNLLLEYKGSLPPTVYDRCRELYLFLSTPGQTQAASCQIRMVALQLVSRSRDRNDVSLAEEATLTYVHSYKVEHAGGIRAVGLRYLAALQPETADFHACRLLQDRFTDPLNGEPAVSAARLLLEHRQLLPLYVYVLQDACLPELIELILPSLASAPHAILHSVYQKYSHSANEHILLALFDLWAAADMFEASVSEIREFLQETEHIHLYRYVLIHLLQHTPQLLQLSEYLVATKEIHRTKLQVLDEVLALLPDSDALMQVRTTIQARLDA